MIILSQENTDIVCKTDKNLTEILTQYKWKVNNQGYPVAYVENRQILLSRFILQLKNISIPDAYVVTYKNRNKLDCRFKNLVIVKKNQQRKKTILIK